MEQSNPIKIDGIYYHLNHDNKTAEVTIGKDEEYTGSIVIPRRKRFNGELYSVVAIDRAAFHNCSKLTSVIIPNTVNSIDEFAFKGCSGLTSVIIPNSVTAIGECAFYECSGLTSVIIPNSVKVIGIYAFKGCSGLTSVIIPNSVEVIGNYAFEDCSGLTSVTIPNSVVAIGELAFCRCSGLTKLVVDLENPSYDSREGCNAIIESSTNKLIAGCKSTIIPKTVTTIGKSAFEGCSGLALVSIPSSVTTINIGAFSRCSDLVSFTCLAIEPPICRKSFDEINEDCRLFVPKESIDKYKAAEGWKEFEHISAIEDMDEEE